MMVLLALFGGMALLLYGIQLTGDSLQRAAGGKLRGLLTGLARNRFTAVFSGAAVTALVQSSSATTVMLIGFVSAGLMTFRQTLGIILGADIGTTLTVQLIAFKLTDYAVLLVGIGFSVMFLAQRRVIKDVGSALLGFGLMFLGLKLILEGAVPIKTNPLATQVIASVADSPVLAVIVAAGFSALVHSSAATIGLALALATEGLLSLPGAVSIVIGANVGTCATALMAAVGSSAEAKRVALAHIAFKVLGAALALPLIGPFTDFVADTASGAARQIANAHTFFNIGVSLIFLPFMPFAARAIEALVPADEVGENPFKTRYLDVRSLDHRSRWGRRRARRCAWRTWCRGCCAT
jgi:phosphate:Na+ symporter